MGSHRLGWTVVVCTALLIAVVAWTSPDSRPYSPRNAGPNGHGTFTALVGAQGATGAQLTGVQTVVVPAARELTSAEAATLREVPGRGGTLVLPVGAVPGNQMLEALGVPVRVSDAYVREIAVRLRQPNLVYATSPFRTQVLEARTASALTVEPPARPVAFSSNISYLDADDNLNWQQDERIGPLPLVAEMNAGPGRILVIGDPNVFTGLQGDINRGWFRAWAGPAPVILYTDVLAPQPDAAARDLLLALRSALQQQVVLALAVGGLVLGCYLLWTPFTRSHRNA